MVVCLLQLPAVTLHLMHLLHPVHVQAVNYDTTAYWKSALALKESTEAQHNDHILENTLSRTCMFHCKIKPFIISSVYLLLSLAWPQIIYNYDPRAHVKVTLLCI